MTTTDFEFLEKLEAVAAPSKHPRVKVAALIVDAQNTIVAQGYNCFPQGIDHTPPARSECPEYDHWIEHAERNAIYAAAKAGVKLEGCRIYTSCRPCTHCARAIIQTGIKEIICPPTPDHMRVRWQADFDRTDAMFAESGVQLRELTQS